MPAPGATFPQKKLTAVSGAYKIEGEGEQRRYDMQALQKMEFIVRWTGSEKRLLKEVFVISKVFVNFPVQDVIRATSFYEKLGFRKDEAFSDPTSSAMVWDAHFWIMLHTLAFRSAHASGSPAPSSAALIAFSLPSAESVKRLGDLAKENGGEVYAVEEGIPEDQMYGLEIRDPDGNGFEPVWVAQ